jgi:NADPH-dependent curcumin reductase
LVTKEIWRRQKPNEEKDMNSPTGRQIVLAARPNGKPKLTDFRLEEIAVPTPSPGQILLGVQYLSLDPYMRGRMDDRKSYAKPLQIGDVMVGEAVARVIACKHPDYARGEIVLAQTGWRTHALLDLAGQSGFPTLPHAGDLDGSPSLRKLDPAAAPVTTALGVLGMPGFTAYSGLRLIGKPKSGETVVVAAASGPVGSLVGQLAKIEGARAVGIAGGPEKCAYVKNELHFDAAIDHRAADFPAQLAAACPKGIDVYFENVGGAIWQAVLPLLNNFARIPVCGLVAQYNGLAPGDGADWLPATMGAILSKSLMLRGFINDEFAEHHYDEFLREVGAGIRESRIRYREDIVDGLEKAPEAFIGMLDGQNFGKAIVRVSA